MKKLLALVLAVVMMLGIASAASAETVATDSLQAVLDAGVLKVGYDPEFAPLTFKAEDGTVTGYDAELAAAVAAKLGVEVQMISIPWDYLESALEQGVVDCVWSGLSITPDRDAAMTLSDAYLLDNNSLVVSSDITAIEELEGLTVAIQVGSSMEEILCEAEFADFTGSVVLVGVYDVATAFRALTLSGTELDPENPEHRVPVGDKALPAIDAILMSDLVARYNIETNEALAGYTVIDSLYSDSIGIAFAKGNYKLCGAIEEILFGMAQDGSLAEITTKWFGTDISVFGK